MTCNNNITWKINQGLKPIRSYSHDTKMTFILEWVHSICRHIFGCICLRDMKWLCDTAMIFLREWSLYCIHIRKSTASALGMACLASVPDQMWIHHWPQTTQLPFSIWNKVFGFHDFVQEQEFHWDGKPELTHSNDLYRRYHLVTNSFGLGRLFHISSRRLQNFRHHGD